MWIGLSINEKWKTDVEFDIPKSVELALVFNGEEMSHSDFLSYVETCRTDYFDKINKNHQGKNWPSTVSEFTVTRHSGHKAIDMTEK